MRIAAALAAADKWRLVVALHVNLGPRPIADMWLQAGRVAGYDFLPLTSIAEIAEEADTMRNCLHTYGFNLAHNRSRLWSVGRRGKRVATLRVATRYRDPLPSIVELKGAGNAEAPRELWWAARQWLHMHDLLQVNMAQRNWGTAPLHRTPWLSLGRPYWLAKRRIRMAADCAVARRARKAVSSSAQFVGEQACLLSQAACLARSTCARATTMDLGVPVVEPALVRTVKRGKLVERAIEKACPFQRDRRRRFFSVVKN